MIRIGVAQWCLDCTGVHTFERAAGLGLCAMHIDAGKVGEPFCLGDAAVQHAYLQASQRSRVEITAIAVNALNTYGITSLDSQVREQCLDTIRLAIDAASAMDVGLVFIPSFDNSEIHSEQELTRTADLLRGACRYAEKRKVLIATENTLDSTKNLKLLALVNHPCLRVLVDSFNPVLWGHSAAALIEDLWPHISNQIHAKDGMNGVMGNTSLGEGEANIRETLALLRAKNFDGFLVLENNYRSEAEFKTLKDIAFIRTLMSEEH